MNLDWGHDTRHHAQQGPPILTRHRGESPRVNVRVSMETHRKIADIATAYGWTYSRAGRLVIAAGLVALHDRLRVPESP